MGTKMTPAGKKIVFILIAAIALMYITGPKHSKPKKSVTAKNKEVQKLEADLAGKQTQQQNKQAANKNKNKNKNKKASSNKPVQAAAIPAIAPVTDVSMLPVDLGRTDPFAPLDSWSNMGDLPIDLPDIDPLPGIGNPSVSNLKLTGIIIDSDGNRSAIINGEVYSENDEVLGYKVRSIPSDDRVELVRSMLGDDRMGLINDLKPVILTMEQAGMKDFSLDQESNTISNITDETPGTRSLLLPYKDANFDRPMIDKDMYAPMPVVEPPQNMRSEFIAPEQPPAVNPAPSSVETHPAPDALEEFEMINLDQ